MELVVDANILVAGFIRFATTRELLLDKRLTLWTPEHSLAEAEKVLVAPRIYRRIRPATPDMFGTASMRFTITTLESHGL